MAEYINKDEIRNHLYSAYRTAEKLGFSLTEDVVLLSIDNAIPADVEEQKRGSWIEDGYYNKPCVCSYCGEPCKDTVMGKPRWIYCPMCGSKNQEDSP